MIDSFPISQKTNIGIMTLDLTKNELLMLYMMRAKAKDLLPIWNMLWEQIRSYDEIPASCRQLMPAVVRRMQVYQVTQSWLTSHNLKLYFLNGLPRYVWTKNILILQRLEDLARESRKEDLEIIAVKGLSELIGNNESEFFRPTLDIDILIRRQDLPKLTKVLKQLDYRIAVKHSFLRTRSTIPKRAHVYHREEPLPIDIDVHFTMEDYNHKDSLTNSIWKNKVPSMLLDNLYIPSNDERYLISLLNSFRISNWENHSYLKYLNDSIQFLSLDANTSLKADFWRNVNQEIPLEWHSQVSLLSEILKELKSANTSTYAKSNLGKVLNIGIPIDGNKITRVYYYVKFFTQEIDYICKKGLTWNAICHLFFAPIRVIVSCFIKGLTSLLNKQANAAKAKKELLDKIQSKKIYWRPYS